MQKSYNFPATFHGVSVQGMIIEGNKFILL